MIRHPDRLHSRSIGELGQLDHFLNGVKAVKTKSHAHRGPLLQKPSCTIVRNSFAFTRANPIAARVNPFFRHAVRLIRDESVISASMTGVSTPTNRPISAIGTRP